jgi:hypothetical protein
MSRKNDAFWNGDGYGDDFDAAEFTGMSLAYLRKLRCVGGGPKYAKLGKAVRHKREWLAAWMDSNARASTSDFGREPVAAGGKRPRS